MTASRARATLEALLGSPELHTGLALGAVGLVLVLVGGRRDWPRPARDPGCVLAVSVVAGLAHLGLLRGADTSGGLLVLAALTAVVAGVALALMERESTSRGLGAPLVALSALGVYFTVPETSRALVVLGAAVPLALAGLPPLRAWMTPFGAVAAWATLTWVSSVDGQYRGSAVVGALGCVGLVAVEPLARMLRSGQSPLAALGRRRWATAALLGLHLGLVYMAARVAGLEASAGRALLVLGATWALAAVCLAGFAELHSAPRPRLRRASGRAEAAHGDD